ncbi:MAG: spore cortex biosynthesis protein YabQ [Oscillospiraceae bacterium]|nr:spore cortex biosynthesis protein YabQ [Oscillospiraceae bacterium]
MSLETFFSVSEQTSQFLLSIVLGAGIGVFYDCFRVLRILFPPARRTAAVAAEDVVFMLASGGAIFLFAFFYCRSQVRFFCIIGSLLGFILYILTVGSVVTGIIRAIAAAVYRVLHKVYSAIFAPIVNFIKVNCQKIFNIFVHSYENRKKIK